MTDRHLTPVLDEAPPDVYAPADWTPPRNGHPVTDLQVPHDHDAERDVLAGILHRPATLDDVTLIVTAEDFHEPAHELIYGAIVALYSTTRPVDITTVANQLATDLRRAGGRGALEQLHYRGTGIVDPGYHAQIVKDISIRRHLHTVGTRIQQLAQTSTATTTVELLDTAADELAAIPRGVPGVDPDTASSWAPVDISDILAGTHTGPVATTFTRRDGKALLYPESVHSISGEPGSGKTWAALIAAAQELEQDHDVIVIDFEDRASSVVNRLLQLGVPPQTLAAHLRYVRPDTALDGPSWKALADAAAGTTLAVIDGITEAMTMHGLSLMDNEDVAKWLELIPRRLADLGPAVVQIDHVVKNADSRGRYAIGGQHKLAGITGVAYKMLTIRSFGRGEKGHAKLVIDKDKHGDVGPNGVTAADVHLDATDPSGALYGWVDSPEIAHDEEGNFRPTNLMKRVSDFLLVNAGPKSLNEIKKGVKGGNDTIPLAVDALIREGHVRVERAGNRTALHYFVTAFEDD